MRIDYENELNEAQLKAACHTSGPVLVIAGAGSGKTRTIVYRLARLVETGISPESILLMTFTRKASQEMLWRAGQLLDMGLTGVSGGTFHSFAYSMLRRYAIHLGLENGFSIMDQSDSTAMILDAKEATGAGKGDRSFPKKDTVLGLISKSRNKERDLSTILAEESYHLLPYANELENIAGAYTSLKRKHGLFDYDDLLFEFERLLRESEEVRNRMAEQFRYIMVDEFQDTNLVQARIVKLIAGERANIMAVGDDAQSIYAFRGANVANILNFPKTFPGAEVIRLERNYRSTQPILDLTNIILAGAIEKYDKKLFTERKDGPKPEVFRCLSDTSQARLIMEKVRELSRKYDRHEIAVLFRAGYQSYALEIQLNKLGLKFQKFGGIRFTEAAHIKDALSYVRLIANNADLPSWKRCLSQMRGVGAKTAQKIAEAVIGRDEKAIARFTKRFPPLQELLDFLDSQRSRKKDPAGVFETVVAFYTPILIESYPDDYPRRQQGLEQIGTIASQYADCDEFLADVSLENPGAESKELQQDALVLSTIHSAKGLEWKAVLIIDLVEDRFPSRKALQRPEDMEEERRLMYVACTRARDYLGLFVPENIRQGERSYPVRPSPFLLELPNDSYRELKESYAGTLTETRSDMPGMRDVAAPAPTVNPTSFSRGETGSRKQLGYCNHKIYGRGKIIEEIPPDKYRINFPGFGLKVIVGQYLEME